MKVAALLILAADAAAASEATCNSEGTAAEQAACCALTEKAPTQARAARRAARPAITELHPTTPPRAHDGTRRNFAARKIPLPRRLAHGPARPRSRPRRRSPARPQPKYLKFCQDYNQLACCIPGHDLENQIQFENLIEGLGPGCKNPMMYPSIRFFYCLGCDPLQPKYTQDGKVRVCSSFLDRIWEKNGTIYDQCGVMKPNDCPDDMQDFDPYTCGDDLQFPSNAFKEGPGKASPAVQFINFYKPPGMDDYDFIDGGDTDCWEPMGNSAASLAASLGASLLLVGGALARIRL